MARFYGHFAAAYGTFWFVMIVVAIMSQSHVNAGEFGLYGFPLIAIIYAAFRVSTPDPRDTREDELRQRMARMEQRLDRE